MVSFLKIKLVKIAEFLHFRIFGYEMSDAMKKFLNHLSWSFSGGIIAASILLILNVLAGRWLGPTEYGRYSLVIAISSIFIIPMTMGVETAITYYISKNKEDSIRKDLTASSLWMVIIFIIIIFSITNYLSHYLENIFTTQNKVIIIAIIFSVLLAMRNIFDAILKGFHFFKYQSFLRMLEAVITAVFFIIFFEILRKFNFQFYVYAIFSGYIFTILMVLWIIRKNITLSLKYSKKILSYGIFAILGSLFGIMTSSFDKILINKYIGQEQLGIYNAYMTASFLLATQIMTLFINVFFPFLASIRDNGMILKKLNKLLKIFLVPALIIFGVIIWVILMVFGEKYGTDWVLLCECSLFSVLSMYFTTLWWLIASKGRNGIKFTSFNGIISGIIFILLMFIFNSVLNLRLVVLFLIFAIFYAIIKGNLMYDRIK